MASRMSSMLRKYLLVSKKKKIANILGCSIEKLPTTYLGMPLGGKQKKLLIWEGIIHGLEKELAIWKSQYLLLGGRHTLINAVLDYGMTLFPPPAKVLKNWIG